MSQNKIPIVLADRSLQYIFNEFIDEINKESNISFEIMNSNSKEIKNYQIIIADQESLKFLQKNKFDLNLSKIYLFKNHNHAQANNVNNIEIVDLDLPFKANEFFERITNDLKQKSSQNKRIKKFKKFSYDFIARILFNDSQSLRFTEKENEIFSCLLTYNKKPVNRKSLLNEVWKYDEKIDTHTLETHIYSLRKKIEAKLGLKNFLKYDEDGYIIDTSLL